jgi:hypothetical protein
MAKKKFKPTDQVTHPFPKKGSRRFVKFNYREYLIEENPDQDPAPLLSKEEVVESDSAKASDQEFSNNDLLKESDGKAATPPKGYVEVRIPLEGGSERRVALGKHREKGRDIQFRCFAMDTHIYWVPADCKV